MPVIDNVSTVESKSIWKTPDGQREIFEVVLNFQGKPFKAKTYSKDISQVGWSGTVESYEKDGRNGVETFVKQPPKEGGYSGNTQNGNAYSSTGNGSGPQTSGWKGYQGKDEKAIQAMWAIGKSIEAHVGEPEFTTADLESVRSYAIELNKMVEAVKESGAKQQEDVVVEDIGDEPVDLSDIETIIGKNEETTPWGPART